MQRQLLLALQIFQVAILLLHDWIPAPPLNDIRAARRQHSLPLLALGSLISALLPSIGLVLSLRYEGTDWPRWLYPYLLFAYSFLFIGELEAWWIPYFFRPQPKRAAEYEAMYANTWSFLPARNGIRVNGLHFFLHLATLATLVTLVVHFLPGAP